jgi:acyl-CoA synthetase (AMP-forming)/AMP-acid ligase II/surface polysaccharide O-acyltransferase-like enzyme
VHHHQTAFWNDLSRHGSNPALVFDEGFRLSYAELDRLVERLCARLDSDWRLVAVEMAPSAHAVAALLACLRSGLAVILLPKNPEAELASVRRRFMPDAVFRCVGDRWGFCEERERSGRDVHPDLALVLVTSGSTGEGKAVRLSGAALAANADQIARSLSLVPADRALLTLPLHYAYGLSVLLSHLRVGASVYLPGRPILGEGFAAAAAAAEPTNLPGVPFTFDLLEQAGFADQLPGGIRFATVAGGRMEPDRVLAWKRRLSASNGSFYLMYGASEATARMSLVDVTRVAGAEQTIGLPVPGGRFEIVGEDGLPVRQPSQQGELCYHGPNVMMGYAADRGDLARGAQCERLMTGDVAFRRPDGLYQIVGRKSRFSKIAGVRIGHDALEAAMARRALPCAVIGDDTAITAFHDQGDTKDYLTALAAMTGLGRSRIAACSLEAIPRLPSGKIDYAGLRASAPTRPAPGNGIEALFADSFFPHRVSPSDSFAGLSGDSLKHVEISLGLEKCLKHIPPGWERMPVRDLSRLQPEPSPRRQGLSTELVIRALAIFMVVLQHATLWPVPGGAAAMTVLLGYAMARFQLPALVVGDHRSLLRPLLRILGPYYLILLGYTIAWGQIPWASVFLVGNFGLADPVRHTMLPYLYWFVEAFCQILVVVMALFAMPAVRKLGARDPFRLGLCFLMAALALRFLSPLVWEIGNRKLFTLPWILPLAAFGWCAAHADTSRRRFGLLALALSVMPLFAYHGGNWTGSWVKYLLQAGVVGCLVYLPAIAVPAWLRRPLLVVAHSSFHIYLFHRFVPELLILPFETIWPQPIFQTVAITGGMVLGIATCWGQGVLVRLFRGGAPLVGNARTQIQASAPAAA